jgi:aminoglycoside phosphotransferase (APT) family kinase protein
VRIDVPLVRRLIAAHFPQWASLAVEPVESAGWDNTIYRLGSDLTVRLPRRRVSAEHVRDEHRWVPVLAPQLHRRGQVSQSGCMATSIRPTCWLRTISSAP